MKDINEMSKKELLAIPYRRSFNEVLDETVTSVIIIPMGYRDIHDSGYRCMDFIACSEDKTICRLSGCSDVLHLGGIIALVTNQKIAWSIDCLKKSGYLRVFCNKKLIPGAALSSFELLINEDKP